MGVVAIITHNPKDQDQMRVRNFVFTHNNYEGTDIEDNVECRYIIYGKEVGDLGTPHLQGFVTFGSLKSLKQAIALLPGSHVQIAKTCQEAIAYCKKDGDFVERGKAPLSQSEKGDLGKDSEKRRWEDIYQAAREGRVEDLPAEIKFKNRDLIKKHRHDALRERKLEDQETQNEWYWGASGTGKSRTARSDHPDAFLKMCNKWWDGYIDQDTVLIEDFDADHEKLAHHLKIWGDRYPFPIEVKGGSFTIRPKKIIVTSNYHPDQIWDKHQDLEPILRRFKMREFTTEKPIANLTDQIR